MAEEKVVRICWNTNSWCSPSGPEGKSKNKDSYEEIVGYGHEEWLFDLNKVVEGYHYSFLQAANTGRNVHKDSDLKVYLYSINSETKTRWWIGSIDNLQIVPESESERIYQIYKEQGWLDEMIDQVGQVGASSEDLRKTDPKILFTVKFRPSDLCLEEPPKEFSADDDSISATYYNFQPYLGMPDLLIHAFNFVPGHNPGKNEGWRTYEDNRKKIDNLHNQIQNGIYLQLIKIYGNENVGTEQLTSNGTKIDIVAKDNNKGLIFYEIKTSSTVLGSIREAFAQLLEYSYYPDSNYATKLVIVSPNIVTEEVSIYMKNIRNKFGIPIYYQSFDMAKNQLEPELH
ncbi:hypothetical protein [Halomonas sp. H5]|uniref:hypothetical protein n=1 Tax=Halomonas sp. H5 TaxID=3423910 RepID=UPI003D36F65A